VTAQNIFRFEALLTDAYLLLVRHIWRGKTAHATFHSDSVAVSLLQSASVTGALINNVTTMENSLTGYRSLKQVLRLFIDSLSPELKTAVLSDEPIVHDSILSRIRTIEINLERWRLERNCFGTRYILINIPAFTLYLVGNDSVLLESKVIVGTPERQTPMLSSIIECFVTYPYWHVPRKIAVEEYLPLIQKDISFIERSNFDVLDIKGNVVSAGSLDWKKFNEDYFPVKLRQREGAENALGVIKFVFDNPYGVFLHDTNAKRLFRSNVRAFSHGCIRMEKAVQLAHYLVTGDLNKNSKYVERFLKEESRHYIELQKPIPIHIRYYTCEFKNNLFMSYKDVYTRDKNLFNLLYGTVNNSDF
jgi:L,D-transpeptidase YcbB